MDKFRGLNVLLVVLGAGLIWLTDLGVWRILVALGLSWAIFRMGWSLLGGFSRPVPEPPPAGELRKVKIQFRCSICGTEVRMTVAPDQEPDAPRHCLEDMDLVTPTFD